MRDLVERLLKGDQRAAAHLITLIEDGRPEARDALQQIYPRTGHAHIVGVTGAPGTGKSTLIGQLGGHLRERGQKVAVIAVDSTSPFTGGAFLGDRLRMRGLGQDGGVFIRSMATRGELGGLARGTGDALHVLDAMGNDVVLVETVGAGQDEVEVRQVAHTTIVLQVPGTGDDIQAIKAGLLEIADIYVVNKADREGAEAVAAHLRALLELGDGPQGWVPPIISTIATTGEGVGDLAEAVWQHQAYLRQTGGLWQRAQAKAESELLSWVRELMVARLTRAVDPKEWQATVRDIAERHTDPYNAAHRLVESLLAQED